MSLRDEEELGVEEIEVEPEDLINRGQQAHEAPKPINQVPEHTVLADHTWGGVGRRKDDHGVGADLYASLYQRAGIPQPKLRGDDLMTLLEAAEGLLGHSKMPKYVSGQLGAIIGILALRLALAGKDNSELREENRTDHLTGLLNRRGFLDRLLMRLSTAILRREVVRLAIIDLTRFKAVNDTFGHLAGDRALQHFATQVLPNMASREEDLAGRYGGDEFVVFSSDPPGADWRECEQAHFDRVLRIVNGLGDKGFTFEDGGNTINFGCNIAWVAVWMNGEPQFPCAVHVIEEGVGLVAPPDAPTSITPLPELFADPLVHGQDELAARVQAYVNLVEQIIHIPDVQMNIVKENGRHR